MFKQFTKSTLAVETKKLLFGMAGSPEPWIIHRCETATSLRKNHLFIGMKHRVFKRELDVLKLRGALPAKP